jgi:hypothetical protein
MQRYHDKADVDFTEQPAPAGSGVNMVPLQRPVEVELDLLRLDYSLSPEMAVSNPHEDRKLIMQEYLSYTTPPFLSSGMGILRFWEVRRMWRMGNAFYC